MHNATDADSFMIKGPMGKGCNLENSGTYVAFAAGTGALVYLDLVARMILQNSGNLPADCERLGEDFRFHFFISFVNRDEAIGLDLCEALLELNKAKGIENFTLTVRLSEQKDGAPRAVRWNKDYIMPILKSIEAGTFGFSQTPVKTKIKKIYVCGPPMMNEAFDKDLFIKMNEKN
jgi:NAD(P)H-flavin reductase